METGKESINNNKLTKNGAKVAPEYIEDKSIDKERR